MANDPKPRRDMTREKLTFPPHGRTSRGNKVIFSIFVVIMIAIVVFALYVTFNTDTRKNTIDIFNTETAELYNTAAANSTSTAAASVGTPIATVPANPVLIGTATVAAATP